ncbi:MAG TPA: glycosyltransferase family A protein [Mycobacteriales bacterium]|nr:glycosyltransferase family A protein [Mycobacteriales bacterium]
MSTRLVSVVVPTKDVGRTIRRCLESIRAQDHRELELIVVDNFSGDATFGVAQELADVAVQRGPERSAQRNHAIALATGRWVLWADADMRLSPRVVSDAVETAEREDAIAVFIPETSVGEGFWTACRALERRCYAGEPMIEAPRLVRRDFFERSGGFVADVAGQEDAELRMRLLADGARLAWSTAAIEHDEGRLTFGGVMRKRLYYGRSIPAYAAAAPGAVPAQALATLRAFARHWRLLAADPVHAVGMLVLRSCELVAYGAGALRARRAAGVVTR